MKKNFFSVIAIALSALLLASCGQQAKSLYTPTASPLPSSGTINWNDIPESWTGTGGKEASEILKWGVYEGGDSSAIPIYDTTSDIYTTDDGISVYSYIVSFSGLPDEAMQNKLNGEIKKAADDFLADHSFFEKHAPKNSAKYDEINLSMSIYSEVSFVGNVLTVNLILDQSIWAVEDPVADLYFSKSQISYKTFCYDLLTGQPLTLSDLFIDDTDLSSLLNGYISAVAENYDLSRPFRGLPKDYPNFMLANDSLVIYFPTPNPYADYMMADIPLERIADCMVQPKAAFSEIFGEENTFAFYRSAPRDVFSISYDKDKNTITPFGIDDYVCMAEYLTSKERPEVAEKINTDLKKLYDELESMAFPAQWQEVVDGGFNTYQYAYCDLQLYQPFISFSFSASFGTYVDGDTGEYIRLYRCYDARTGDIITLDDLIGDKEGFEGFLKAQGIVLEEGFSNFVTYDPKSVCFYPGDLSTIYSEGYYSDIPAEFINTDYFKYQR